MICNCFWTEGFGLQASTRALCRLTKTRSGHSTFLRIVTGITHISLKKKKKRNREKINWSRNNCHCTNKQITGRSMAHGKSRQRRTRNSKQWTQFLQRLTPQKRSLDFTIVCDNDLLCMMVGVYIGNNKKKNMKDTNTLPLKILA